MAGKPLKEYKLRLCVKKPLILLFVTNVNSITSNNYSNRKEVTSNKNNNDK